MADERIPGTEPLWYKDAVIYQLHVKSFYDGRDDGIGDFPGLTQKLGYLESLGITAVWLLPFYVSPLRDDGYDISDYLSIHPSYGSINDFKDFLDEAHSRGIRVITELVLNHTSDQHEWFKKSRAAKPGTRWRDFYVWSDTNDRYREARVIFKDFETSNWTWDPVGKAYFWHRFYSHQPDLNFDSPHVHKALLKVIDFWLGLGVDGLRLDAVPYLYEQEGTNCENLPQTFEFLRKVRAHVEERFPGRMLLAEANQWPEDAVAYFGKGDMCHMAFHFPLMPRMFMALQMEDRFPVIDILDQTPAIPESAQWAIFLRNHDELTLEMVSEEERDFMYRSYARDLSSRINVGIRRRLSPLLQNSRRRIELLNILLLSLPGTPVIYYGDEIGMGDNHFLGDRNGVRTPMQWSADRNAGFSLVNPQQLFLPVIIDPEYHYQTVNVENEERNLSSLLWWMRRAIAMRRTFQAFSRGSMQFINSSNASVLSFVRKLGDETVLVVVNLSRFGQPVSLELGGFAGSTPVDVFSGSRFPRIGAGPYPMTLGFHDYFWLHLKPDDHADPRVESYALPDFAVGAKWQDIFDGASGRNIASEILPEYLQQRTTVGCRPKRIQQTAIIDQVSVRRGDVFNAVILLVRVRYIDGDGDVIFLPLALESEDRAALVIGEDKGLIMGLANGGAAGVIYDCTYHPTLQAILLEAAGNNRRIRGHHGNIVGESLTRRPGMPENVAFSVRLTKAGRRNSCLVIGDQVFAKLFRRLEEGINPDIELNRKLASQADDLVPGFVGSCTYRGNDGVSCQLALYTDLFPHSATLWRHALNAVSQHLEEEMAGGIYQKIVPPRTPETAGASIPGTAASLLFEKRVRVVGELTARMHRELSTGDDEGFRTEPFTMLYQRSLYQSFRGFTHRVFARIAASLESLPEAQSADLRNLVPREKEILTALTAVLRSRVPAVRMRIHGDFHLGQIMVMDEKYRICDFEGIPTLPLSERRLKRSPLRDVASMAHSLHYAAHYSLLHNVKIQERDRLVLSPKAAEWAASMSEAFTQSYLAAVHDTPIVPSSSAETRALLRLYLFDRGLSDVEKALEFDQDHIPIATRCLLHYLGELPKSPG